VLNKKRARHGTKKAGSDFRPCPEASWPDFTGHPFFDCSGRRP